MLKQLPGLVSAKALNFQFNQSYVFQIKIRKDYMKVYFGSKQKLFSLKQFSAQQAMVK